MKIKRSTLTELINIQDTQLCSPSKNQYLPIVIHYQQIIQKQNNLIQNLYKQCQLLRQKITRIKSQQKFVMDNPNISKQKMQAYSLIIQQQLFKQIGQLLDIKEESEISKNQIIQTIKRLKWQRQKMSQPIFIQLVKQVRIPLPIQTIVEKKVIVEKEVIKYVDKIVQKIVEKPVFIQKVVEVPVFRQKVIQKFVPQVQNNSKPQQKQKSQKQSINDKNSVYTQSVKNNQKNTIKQNHQNKKNENLFNQTNTNSAFDTKKLKLQNFREQDSMRNYAYDRVQNRNFVKSPKYNRNQVNDPDQSFEYDRWDTNRNNKKNVYKNDRPAYTSNNNRTMIYSPRNSNQNNKNFQKLKKQNYQDQLQYDRTTYKVYDSKKNNDFNSNQLNRNIKNRQKYDNYNKYK